MIRVGVLLFALVTACGPSRPPSPAPGPSPLPASSTLPDSLLAYMTDQGWPTMHLQWHTERRWDRLPPAGVEYAQRQGWQRASRQEGDAGNGVEFLAMHRAMIELLIEVDASARPALAGWTAPPTDPNDAADPLPGGATDPFDADMLSALDRLQNHLDSFKSEDELGLYIETSFGASDPSAGVHNYLHRRFQDPTSPIDIGNPSLSLANPRFWRLHGWIDRVWATYRTQIGRRDTDPDYQALMGAARSQMHMRMKAPLEAPPAALIDAVRP